MDGRLLITPKIEVEVKWYALGELKRLKIDTPDINWFSKWVTPAEQERIFYYIERMLEEKQCTVKAMDSWWCHHWNTSKNLFKLTRKQGRFTKQIQLKKARTQMCKDHRGLNRTVFPISFANAVISSTAVGFGQKAIADKDIRWLNSQQNPEVFYFKWPKRSHMNSSETFMVIVFVVLREAVRRQRWLLTNAGRFADAVGWFLFIIDLAPCHKFEDPEK